jgi:hypothetical protein
LREGVAILLFAKVGVAATEATAVAVLFGLVLTAVGLIGALVWMIPGYRKLGRADGRLRIDDEAPEPASSFFRTRL